MHRRLIPGHERVQPLGRFLYDVGIALGPSVGAFCLRMLGRGRDNVPLVFDIQSRTKCAPIFDPGPRLEVEMLPATASLDYWAR